MKGPGERGGTRSAAARGSSTTGAVVPGEHGASARGAKGAVGPWFLCGKHVYVVVGTTLCVRTGSRLGWKRGVGWELRNGPWRRCIPNNRSNININNNSNDMRDIQPGWHAERHVKGRGSGVESALHIDHVKANDGREGRGVGDGGQGYLSYRQ